MLCSVILLHCHWAVFAIYCVTVNNINLLVIFDKNNVLNKYGVNWDVSVDV